MQFFKLQMEFSKRLEQTFHQRRYIDSKQADEKCSTQSLGKCKLTPHWDTTIQPIRVPKIKNLTVPSIGENVEELNLSHTSGENIKYLNHFGK